MTPKQPMIKSKSVFMTIGDDEITLEQNTRMKRPLKNPKPVLNLLAGHLKSNIKRIVIVGVGFDESFGKVLETELCFRGFYDLDVIQFI